MTTSRNGHIQPKISVNALRNTSTSEACRFGAVERRIRTAQNPIRRYILRRFRPLLQSPIDPSPVKLIGVLREWRDLRCEGGVRFFPVSCKQRGFEFKLAKFGKRREISGGHLSSAVRGTAFAQGLSTPPQPKPLVSPSLQVLRRPNWQGGCIRGLHCVRWSRGRSRHECQYPSY
jgi:hypothetical protein